MDRKKKSWTADPRRDEIRGKIELSKKGEGTRTFSSSAGREEEKKKRAITARPS